MARIVSKGIVAKKIGMTRMIDKDSGSLIPVTLLQVENQKVTKVMNSEVCGYESYQVGYQVKSPKNLTKADHGRLRKVGVEENYSLFCEFRTKAKVDGIELGAVLGAALLDGTENVDVTGVTKGRGYQGAVKRWGARIGRKSHGSRFHRRPGSLGQRSTPSRVYKGRHQPGQMGDENCTIRNVELVHIDHENNLLALKGSVPGCREGYLMVTPTNKVNKSQNLATA